MNKIGYLIVHHTGGTDKNPLADTSNHTFEMVNAWHRDAKMSDGSPKYHYGQPSSLGYYMAYHYFIEKDGKLKQARADNEHGNHTKGYNYKSLGICLAGNFDLTLPTWEQRYTLKNLLVKKAEKYNVKLLDIVPHRMFSQKSCFGRRLSNSWARDLVTEATGQKVKLLKQLLSLLQRLLSKLSKKPKMIGADLLETN